MKTTLIMLLAASATLAGCTAEQEARNDTRDRMNETNDTDGARGGEVTGTVDVTNDTSPGAATPPGPPTPGNSTTPGTTNDTTMPANNSTP